MPRGRSASYEDQSELILARAARLFARRGYPATSMNEVAQACNLSKAALYHYHKDKQSLLVSIAETHVAKLAALVAQAEAEPASGTSEQRLRWLIYRIVEEYADAQDAHRVLTDDVRFLDDASRQRVLDQERQVVAGFARAVAAWRPGTPSDELSKPLTMLLFGMVNWMFTWMKPDGRLDHATIAPIVADLFLGGIGAVQAPKPRARRLSSSPAADPGS